MAAMAANNFYDKDRYDVYDGVDNEQTISDRLVKYKTCDAPEIKAYYGFNADLNKDLGWGEKIIKDAAGKLLWWLRVMSNLDEELLPEEHREYADTICEQVATAMDAMEDVEDPHLRTLGYRLLKELTLPRPEEEAPVLALTGNQAGN